MFQYVDGRDIPEDTLESCIVSLEFIYREFLVLELTSNTEVHDYEAL